MVRRALVLTAGSLLPACGLLLGVEPLEVDESPRRDDVVDASLADTQRTDTSEETGPAVRDAAEDVVRTSRRIFVTDTAFSGDLGGLTGADAKCETAAKAARLGDGPWRAWLSIPGATAAIDRVEWEGPYDRVDGKRVVASKALLGAGVLEQSISITEKGVVPPGSNIRVWTGTRPTGQSANHVCGSWSTTIGVLGETGDFTRKDDGWTDDENAPISCDSSARIYCLER